jgi:hypothetical protein
MTASVPHGKMRLPVPWLLLAIPGQPVTVSCPGEKNRVPKEENVDATSPKFGVRVTVYTPDGERKRKQDWRYK